MLKLTEAKGSMSPSWLKKKKSPQALFHLADCLPPGTSDNPHYSLQDDKPKAQSVNEQMVTQKFTQHHRVQYTVSGTGRGRAVNNYSIASTPDQPRM